MKGLITTRLLGNDGILYYSEIRQNIADLKGSANALSHTFWHGQAGDILTVEKDRTAVRYLRPIYLVDQCCLASSIWADQCVSLSTLNR